MASISITVDQFFFFIINGRANVLDCEIVVCEFEFYSRYYIHTAKSMNPLILLIMAQIIPLLFYNSDSFGIK